MGDLKAELHALKQAYASTPEIAISQPEPDLVELVLKNAVTYRLDLSAYPDGITVSKGDDEFDWEEGKLANVVERIISRASLRQSDEDFGVLASDEEEEQEDVDRYKKNEELMKDIHNFNVTFGEQHIRVSSIVALDQLEVELLLFPSDFLSMTTATAWGLEPSVPIVVKVPLHDQFYLKATQPPICEVFQYDDEGKKKPIQLGKQLEGVLTPFVKRYWPSLSGVPLGTARVEDTGRSSSAPSNITDAPRVDDTNYATLLAMGFESTMAVDTLLMYPRIEDAIEYLTGGTPAAAPVKIKERKKTSKIGNTADLFRNPNKALKAQTDEEKMQCSTEHGFLCMLMTYICRRIPTLNNYCVICDQPHVFTSGSMLKPAVCSRELCVWSFQQLGVGAGAASEIATEAEVVDLLVSMAKFSARSARRDTIFDPYPQVVDPDNPNIMILSPDNKDFTTVENLLNKMPSIQKMTQAQDFGSMRGDMDKYHRYCFPLLQWIISSNRCHIVQLAENGLVQSMCTPFQYLLLSDSPEKEERFRALKAEHGTIFAFHGSPIENWHSILRKGLINASGTKLQIHGAAYGAGIYLSPAAATSLSYCRMSSMQTSKPVLHGGARFLDTTNKLACIAICEVINVSDIKKSGDIWVHPHQDMVCTRFFFVYPNECVGTASSCRTDNPTFQQELLSALACYK